MPKPREHSDGETRCTPQMTVINNWLGDFGRVALAAAVGAAAAAGVMLAAQSSSSTRSQLLKSTLGKNPSTAERVADQSIQKEFSRKQRNS